MIVQRPVQEAMRVLLHPGDGRLVQGKVPKRVVVDTILAGEVGMITASKPAIACSVVFISCRRSSGSARPRSPTWSGR